VGRFLSINCIINNKFSNFYKHLSVNKKRFFKLFYKSLLNIQNNSQNSEYAKVSMILDSTGVDIELLNKFFK
jgi:hypothetical protein